MSQILIILLITTQYMKIKTRKKEGLISHREAAYNMILKEILLLLNFQDKEE